MRNQVSKKVALTIIAALCICLALVGCSKNQGNESSNQDSNNSEQVASTEAASSSSDQKSSISDADAQKNIVVNVESAQKGESAAFITNNNSCTVDELKVTVTFYDASNQIIDLDSDGHDMLLPGATVVSRIDTPDSFDHLQTSVEVKVSDHPSYKNHSDQVDIKCSPIKNGAAVTITNNSDVKIEEIEYDVLYYKNDQLVYISYPQDVLNVDAGATVQEKDSIYSSISYDRCDIYLNQAHTFGHEQ
ncbi:MAG: FxLYD domain-containing protein [Eggerthellaceae bacterium]|jgi:uncharacterized protein YcfL|nr:FxLYD domain-containing protein [Eggerthellaceae bacterium]MCH4220933.1 FxLYD domain-containing protein [Eggerthellaceae bacterium]